MADHLAAPPEPCVDCAWRITDPIFEVDEFKPEHKVWPWCGHRNFAYDLVRWLKPARIAELGVHWGTSFFSWAQAIKDARLNCHLIGVDTFEGDEHAGHYGDEVYSTVTDVVQQRFSQQHITIHKARFDDALEAVEDNSCDIIHIDGLHTYDAVKHDFETWISKLRSHGVVLFHDTAASSGYGSATYWEELCSQYPGFAFEHSWGLGVLFPKGDRALVALQQQNIADKVLLYTYKAQFELAEIANKEKAQLLTKRMDAINSQTEMIRHRNTWIERLQSDLDTARSLCDQRLADLKTRSEQMQAHGDRANELKKRAEIAERTVKDHAASIEQLLATIASHVTAHTALEQQIRDEKARSATLVDQIVQLKATSQKQQQTIQSMTQQLAAAAHDLAAREQRLQTIDAMIETLTLDVETIRLRTDHIEATSHQQSTHIDALDASLSRGLFGKKPPRRGFS